ncbi:TPA: helix-turn-helix domain-containing protein [Klebsiella quasipneumoniae]
MSHLTHLRTFLEVYRVRSISQAAVNLGITQPTASLHIQAIEMFVSVQREPSGHNLKHPTKWCPPNK